MFQSMRSAVLKSPVIMVVDDDELAQQETSLAAQAEGFETVALPRALDTRRTAIERQPALILLNVEMPDADGRDVLRELKRDSRTARIPIFVYGKRDSEFDRRLALQLGAEDYWPKPLNLRALMLRIHFHIEKLEAEAESQIRGRDTLDTWPDSSEIDRKQAEILAIEAVRRDSNSKIRASVIMPTGNASKRIGTVLVVENDPDIRQSLSWILEDEGIPVLPAKDGQEALEILQEGAAPVVILLDLMMPRMTGWEFQRRIATLTSAPVVVMSALAPVAAPSSIAWLQKPIDIDKLLSVIYKASEASMDYPLPWQSTGG